MKDSHKAKRQRVETVVRLNPQWATARIARASNVSPTFATKIIGARHVNGYELSNPRIQKAIELLKSTPPVTYEHIKTKTGYSHFKLKKIEVQLGIAKKRPHRAGEKNVGLREQVVASKHENPMRTLASIGKDFGVTRERVRQILKEEGLYELYPPKQIIAKRSGRYLNCLQCNAELPSSHGSNRKTGYCMKCSDIIHAQNYESRRITLICKGCNKSFTMLKSTYNRRLIRKEEYQQTVTHTVQDASVCCSYSCSATIRGFGMYVGKANSKHTPEMLQHISKLRIDGVAVKDILVSIHKHFRARISENTFYSWIRQGKFD